MAEDKEHDEQGRRTNKEKTYVYSTYILLLIILNVFYVLGLSTANIWLENYPISCVSEFIEFMIINL